MPTSQEIEIKKMLSEVDFLKLKSFLFKSPDHGEYQTNHYFDTPTYLLAFVHKVSLRVREKNQSRVLTIKWQQAGKEGKTEIEQRVSDIEWEALRHHGILPEGEVKNGLENIIKSPIPALKIFTSLTTLRYEKPYFDGIIFLDENWYGDNHDFELEYESPSLTYGKKIIQQLLKMNRIQALGNSEPKIKRAYRAMMASNLNKK